ncbi:MAG: transaldolase [Anaerolineae bacterium]|nr:transaldolase [Anaerolineae bacterium]
MTETSYLQWLANETTTAWWHDSAEPEELGRGLTQGAVGVTTNPVLTYLSLRAHPEQWARALPPQPDGLGAEEKAQEWMGVVVRSAAQRLLPVYERTGGQQGYVCAQVNPARAADVKAMTSMAHRFSAWAPNIAVKLPATAAGLDVLEECAAEGITVTATVSFTVPQVIAIAERYRRGLARARRAGKPTGRCFAVIMIGRLDDYLRDVVLDQKADVTEADVRLAGLAVTKRAYTLYKDRSYEAVLLVAALRGMYHMIELAGADLIMSIHPTIQAALLQPGVPREAHIAAPVAPDVIARLARVPEFVKAYEPDGMTPAEFITFGLTQRTLTQFTESGWRLLESYKG